MARAQKVGLDYFPHDVDMFLDQKMRIIKAKHGLIGYAIYIRLLEEIYRDKGYYLEHTDDFAFIFCDDNNIDVNVYKNVINDYINYDLFDKNVYKNHNILTSKRIQITYFEAAKRRTSLNLLDGVVIKCKEIDDYINSINVNINSINGAKSTQSKVKKIREEKKESEEDNNEVADAPIPYKEIIDYLNAKTDKSFKSSSKKNKDHIKARFNDGFTLDDFKKVIDIKSREWKDDPKMEKFLRPETLFSNKFEGYLNQKENHHTKPQDIKEWQRYQKGGPGHYV